MRFSAARQQFHATRRIFWSLWQDHVSSLSVQSTGCIDNSTHFPVHTESRQAERVSGLTIQTLLQGTIQWHSGGGIFRRRHLSQTHQRIRVAQDRLSKMFGTHLNIHLRMSYNTILTWQRSMSAPKELTLAPTT